MGGRGVDTSQTRQKRVAREQSNKYKPRTEQEQYLPIRHAGRPADSWCAFIYLPHITYRSEADSRIVSPFCFSGLCSTHSSSAVFESSAGLSMS